MWKHELYVVRVMLNTWPKYYRLGIIRAGFIFAIIRDETEARN